MIKNKFLFSKICILILSLFLFSKPVLTIEMHFEGYVNGNYYVNNLNKNQQVIYLMGVYDGFSSASGFFPNESADTIISLRDCLSAKIEDSIQLHAIINKFLMDNPSMWKQPMNLIVWNKLSNLCKTS